MPKTNINYSSTIIYKIVCNDLNVKEVYVGHTTNFIKRKQLHKQRCMNATNPRHHLKVYKFINNNEGWDNWSMIEIEKYPCNDSNEATARERHWYETLASQLNMLCPYRSDAERKEIKITRSQIYYENNREDVLTKIKEYREGNKEKIREHKLKVCICECGLTYVHCNKARHLRSKIHFEKLSTTQDTALIV